MEPFKPKAKRFHDSSYPGGPRGTSSHQDAGHADSNVNADSNAGSLTGGSDVPTQQRTLADEVLRLDGADSPTALPNEAEANRSAATGHLPHYADESLIDLAHPSSGQQAETIAQSPAIWLGTLGYRIDRLLGRGGYGEVYLADHPKLPRQVAIKVPRADVVLTAEFKRRFLDEANIVAQLEHPNVVTIHDMIADPYPAIIYEYCCGGTLEVFNKGNNNRFDEPTAIKLFALVADALAFAHNRGVLHRDIKPSNILLHTASHHGDAHSFEFKGQWWTPKLADFGLAKVFGDGNTETASGMIAGTPEYMSPEQAIGRSRDVGTFSDTFSLGVLIYRMLIGYVPFMADNRIAAILKIENGDYVIPRRARPELSVDIEAVIVKSLRAAPPDRYRDAAELLDDLNRMLQGQPVGARPYTWRDRVAQTVRRYPVAVVSSLFTLAGFLLVIAMIWRTSLQQQAVIVKMEAINHELAEAIIRSEASERAEVHQREISEKMRYASEMRLCQESFRKGDIIGYQELLDNHIPAPGQPDHRGFSWYWLWEQGHAKPRTIDQFADAAYWVEFSRDEKWLAACGANGAVSIYSVDDWSLRARIDTEQGEVNGASFSSTGTRIATSGDDGTVKIWDWATGTLIETINAHENDAFAARFINNDKKLVTCGNNPTIRIWNLANPDRPVGELTGHSIGVESIRISPDEKTMVSAGVNGTRVVWDLNTQQAITTKETLRSQRASDVALVSNGGSTKILSASLPGTTGENALLMLEDINSDQQRVLLTSASGIQSICVSQQGNQVAVGDRNGGVTLLDISEILADSKSPDTVPSIVGRWNGHRDRVYCVTYSPSGNHLVTCGKDGNVLRWQPGASQSTRFATLEEVAGSTNAERWTAYAYADQSQQVFAVSSSHAIDRWDASMGKTVRVFQLQPGGLIQTLLVSPDGKRLLVADMHGKIQRIDFDSATDQFVKSWERTDPIDSPPTTCKLALSDDGEILACVYCRNQNVMALIDANTGALIKRHNPKNWLSTDSFGIAISPNTRGRDHGCVAYAFGGDVIVVNWLADQSSPGKLRLLDEQVLNSESDTVMRLCFIDHETLLATTTRNQLVKWNLNVPGDRSLFSGQPKPLKLLRGLPDGREVWTASGRNTIMTWCLYTSQNLIDLPIADVGSIGSICTIGREVTGFVDSRKLFWQPLLQRWPDELKQTWPD